MAAARTVTMRNFRAMDTLSGHLRLISASRRRGGARPLNRPAIDRSPANQAASDDGSGKTDELTAVSGAGSTARKQPSADVAKDKAKEAVRAPEPGSTGEPPSLWDQRMELGKGAKLPQDGWAFLKALNERIDVVALYELMLRSPDEKLAGRLVEQALKLGYEQNPNAEEEWSGPITAHLP